MSRLIDADALVERIIAKIRDTSFFSMIMAEISNVIASLPTVDAEPVIRCKDCKYWEDGYCDDSLIEGLERKVSRFEDDFCSRGEKR